MKTMLHETVDGLAVWAAEDLNERLSFPYGTDQTAGNRCDALTLDVMTALVNRGESVRRELHVDDERRWHYLLAHRTIDEVPRDDDIVSDLNPWQWRGSGGQILHGHRGDVMEQLVAAGAPDFFVALRGLETISIAHDVRKYPTGLL